LFWILPNSNISKFFFSLYRHLPQKDNAKCSQAVNILFDVRIIVTKYWFLEGIIYTSIVLSDELAMMDDMKWILYSGDESITLSKLMTIENIQPDIFPDLQSWLQRQWIHRVMEWEQDFHYKLSLIPSKPRLIYYMGDITVLDQPILGIVWPRQHSSYATDVLSKLFSLAPGYAFVTISGLAPGVDQWVHTLSLQKWIPTIAVLGAWFHHFLSRKERHLIQQIVSQGGLVISEFKIYQWPQSYTFPQRNRIIAWLSDKLLLPEAGEHSGSLITAQFALDMGKAVYGVPNNIFSSTSQGINQLIASWLAHAVTDMQAFLDLSFTPQNHKPSVCDMPDLSTDEQLLIASWWDRQTCTLMDFVHTASFSSSQIISLLTLLEIKWYVCQDSPGTYKRIL